MKTRLVAGCMTGTSIDALDVALVRITGTGLDMRASVQACHTHSLGSLADPLRRLASQEPATAGRIAQLSREFADLHISAISELLASQSDSLDLICVHGQTIFHAPPLTWQLLTPAPIAHAFRVPVVFDLRAADIAAGGQGAPITPIADYILFRSTAETRAIVNLGGFCNFTRIPATANSSAGPSEWVAAGNGDSALACIVGGDISACNQVLNAIARACFGQPFDPDGRNAASGRLVAGPRDELAGLLDAQSSSGRSLGTGDELLDWIERHRSSQAPADLARSACEALASVVVAGVGAVDRVLLAGGGVKNAALREAIVRASAASVSLTDDFGVPAPYREAVAMAVLGALCEDRIPITLPQVTHLRTAAPISGTWIRT